MAEATQQQPAAEQPTVPAPAETKPDAAAAAPAAEIPTHLQVPTHPIAPRLQNGSKIPHIGPHIHAYKAAHSETVGNESDKWWARVSPIPFPFR